MNNYNHHYPVLYREMIENMMPVDGQTYIDCTFGAGGYTKLLLEAANCNVLAIDRDESVKEFANQFEEKYGSRFTFCHGEFADIENIMSSHNIDEVNGIVLDIGVSSMQLDRAERGFSFSHDGPLDMRMDKSKGQSAADYINSVNEKDLANVIFQYGGEKKSRIIARKIIEARKESEIITTKHLADIIRSAVGRYNDTIDPATRTFQAIRILVNEELEQLQKVLDATKKMLKAGGRLVVITFHSLEDKIVKKFLRDNSGYSEGVSRHVPDILENNQVYFEIKTRKAISAKEDELKQNPRARSAKLRSAVRINK